MQNDFAITVVVHANTHTHTFSLPVFSQHTYQLVEFDISETSDS